MEMLIASISAGFGITVLIGLMIWGITAAIRIFWEATKK